MFNNNTNNLIQANSNNNVEANHEYNMKIRHDFYNQIHLKFNPKEVEQELYNVNHEHKLSKENTYGPDKRKNSFHDRILESKAQQQQTQTNPVTIKHKIPLRNQTYNFSPKKTKHVSSYSGISNSSRKLKPARNKTDILHIGPDNQMRGKKQHTGKLTTFLFSKDVVKFVESNKGTFENKIKNQLNDKTYEIVVNHLLHSKYEINTTCQVIFALISMASAIVDFEITREQLNNWYSAALFAQYMCFISSIGLWVSIIYDKYLQSEINGRLKGLKAELLRWSRANIISVIFEFCFFILHPNPIFHNILFLNESVKFEMFFEYHLNALLVIFCLFRMWYILKLFLISSNFYSNRSARVGQLYGMDLELSFSFKANMIGAPYNAYAMLFIIGLTCSFLSLRIFEIPLDEVTKLNFTSYWNSIWCIIITMTTVGYGDFYPSSLLGRIFGIISCFIGVFLVSLFIATIQQILVFENSEETVYLLLDRINLMETKVDKAKDLVVRYIKAMKTFRNLGSVANKKSKFKTIKDKLLENFLNFRSHLNTIQKTYPPQKKSDIIIDSFKYMENSLERIEEKAHIMDEKVKQYMNLNRLEYN